SEELPDDTVRIEVAAGECVDAFGDDLRDKKVDAVADQGKEDQQSDESLIRLQERGHAGAARLFTFLLSIRFFHTDRKIGRKNRKLNRREEQKQGKPAEITGECGK